MNILSNYKILLKSIISAIVISLVLLFVLSIVLAMTSVKENVMDFSIIFIASISILISAFYASKRIKEKGIIYGAIVGFLYMLILYLISSIVRWDFTLTLQTMIMILAGILGGAIGGILGVNLK